MGAKGTLSCLDLDEDFEIDVLFPVLVVGFIGVREDITSEHPLSKCSFISLSGTGREQIGLNFTDHQ